jgi:DNA-binding CsgD family transcriptional regulator
MLLTKTGLELVEQLESQGDIPSLLEAFQRVVVAFGMSAFCIGDPANPKVKRKNRKWDGTFPARFYQHYANRNFFASDPTVARMNVDPSPFRWSDNYEHAGPSGKHVLDEVFALGVEDGLAVSIHGPHGAITGVSIGAEHYGLARQDERALHMASLYLHVKMTALGPASPPPLRRRLTPRERECLQWVAAGKTDWEISQILNISEQTVHGYVQSALAKLEARTRAQAVALAIQSTQIQP